MPSQMKALSISVSGNFDTLDRFINAITKLNTASQSKDSNRYTRKESKIQVHGYALRGTKHFLQDVVHTLPWKAG